MLRYMGVASRSCASIRKANYGVSKADSLLADRLLHRRLCRSPFGPGIDQPWNHDAVEACGRPRRSRRRFGVVTIAARIYRSVAI